MLILKHTRKYVSIIFVLLSLQALCEEPGASYSPNVGKNYPNNVCWGDTHLHTNQSVDASWMGNKALTPDDAYRFAKGEVITAHNGQKARLSRPLDFLVVADHAENIGVMPGLEEGNPTLVGTAIGEEWRRLILNYPLQTQKIISQNSAEKYREVAVSVWRLGPLSFFWRGLGQQYDVWPEPVGYIGNESFRKSVWREVISNAERHNDPGKFTAFAGFEWSSEGSRQGNLHRVVIFKDGPEKTSQVLPFSRIDSPDPADLWSYLKRYEEEAGGEVLAIPHNGNKSNGEMFALQDFKGDPLSFSYAKIRSRWEPLYEVTQIKGDSETHPVLSPKDEFADFETWNSHSGWTYEGVKTEGWELRKASEYARSALKIGLDQQVKLGINPFKFGLIGSTDAHTSLSTADDDNFWGEASLLEPSPYRINDFTPIAYQAAASGYAAVWATENTRAAIFAAMKRKETYATTGPRMVVRFFGGWDYKSDDAFKPDLAEIGYSKGVSMGGDLRAAPEGKVPSFLIRAVKDPVGANLDRVQVIKGWRGQDGALYEKIYNVALSDGRREGPDGTAPLVGNTVDVANANYTNTIGDPELAVVWRDPDFDPNELAFYYLRVLEIPTPRWTAYDAKYFGVRHEVAGKSCLTQTKEQKQEDCVEIPMVTQERAYTSPIWYSPPAKPEEVER